MRFCLFCSLVLFSCCQPPIQAQLVNVEDLRLRATENGWYGLTALNFQIRRNKAGQTINLGFDGRIENLHNRNRWIFIGAYRFTRFNDLDDPNSGSRNFANLWYGHIRYDRKITELLTWEVFTQSQFNEIQEIDIRLLYGTGPRFRVLRSDSLYLNVGLTYMFEYEETSDLPEQTTFNRHHRMSSYLSLGFLPTDRISIQTVFYFQPRPDKWKDNRLTNNTNLSISISRTLAFEFNVFFTYDTQPPITVPNLMYSIQNGLSLRF